MNKPEKKIAIGSDIQIDAIYKCGWNELYDQWQAYHDEEIEKVRFECADLINEVSTEKDKEIAKLKHDLDYHPANPFPLFNQKGFEKLSIENERLKKEIAELKKENEAFFNRPACEEPMMDALLTSQSNVKKLEAELSVLNSNADADNKYIYILRKELSEAKDEERYKLRKELADLKSRMTVEAVEKILRERLPLYLIWNNHQVIKFLGIKISEREISPQISKEKIKDLAEAIVMGIK